MASTFGENKKLKHNQTTSPSWNNHIGLEKSNTGSLQQFSALRNTKTNSKSDKSTNLSTTDQGNGEDTGQEGKEPTEGPDHRLIRSNWNEFCLVFCDKCDYFYDPQAFMYHLDVRHLQPQDPSVNQESPVQQHKLYEKKPKSTRVPENEKKKKVKNGKKNTTELQSKRPLQKDDSKNNDSKANSVDKQAVTSGPGPGPGPPPGQSIDPLGKNKKKAKRKKGTNWTKGKRSQKIVRKSNKEASLQIITETVVEVLGNCEEASLQMVTENFIKEPVNYQLKGSQNCVVDVESPMLPVTHGGFGQLEDGLHCGNFPSDVLFNQSTNSKIYSGPPLVNNVINSKARDSSNPGTNQESMQSLYKTLNVFSLNNNAIHHHTIFPPPRNKLNCHPDNTSPNNGYSVILNQELHNGPSKIFNGNRNNAQRHNSVICGETRNNSFQNENNAYLKSVGDGSELSSRKCIRKTKPGVKLKRQKIKEKLKTALDTQCLQTIKLEPMKIKKALSSINRVCRARTIEQFRTFSHLKRIMPSGKNSPHRTRVSCSVNTGAKSACINTWNKVPFRYEPRKSFFPLGGSLQADSGVVLSDSPYKALRATFIQNELVSVTTNGIEEVKDEGFATFELNIYDDQQNGSLPSYDADSPWDYTLVDDQPDSNLNNHLESDLMDYQQDSNLVNDQPESDLKNVQLNYTLMNGQPESVLVNPQADSDFMNLDPDSDLRSFQPDSIHMNMHDLPDYILNVQPDSVHMNCQSDPDILDGQPDSGYLSQYDPDSTNGQHLDSYSPISSPPEYGYEKRDEQQVKPGRQEDSQNFQEPEMLKNQIICIYPTNFNINENGIHQGYNREQNQGCTDR